MSEQAFAEAVRKVRATGREPRVLPLVVGGDDPDIRRGRGDRPGPGSSLPHIAGVADLGGACAG
jgi:hypothetical protein